MSYLLITTNGLFVDRKNICGKYVLLILYTNELRVTYILTPIAWNYYPTGSIVELDNLSKIIDSRFWTQATNKIKFTVVYNSPSISVLIQISINS